MKPKIHNMVITANFYGNVNLNRLLDKLEGAEYEPNQFPGLIYRMKKPKVSFLLFGSGKIVCTGARRKKQIIEGIKILVKILKNIKGFKKSS